MGLGELTLNLEGVSSWTKTPTKGKPGPACIGVILRDETVGVIAKFTASVGIRDSNEVEFLAILTALDLSSDKEWIRKGTLIVESNSKLALAWIKSSCPWKLCFYGNKMKNLQWSLGNVILTHKTRESNEIADSLAQEGASSNSFSVEWYNLVCILR